MINSFGDIFKVQDLKRKIGFTFLVLAVYRVGTTVPLPGVNAAALQAFFAQQEGVMGFLNMFSGGAMARLSVFALGIMPYINASIIMSLLQTSIPYLEKLSKEGAPGREKITRMTRYATLLIGAVQAFGLTFWIQSMKTPGGEPVLMFTGLGFRLLLVLTMLTGTLLVMWLGEQITESGIGNGISLIIFTGIVAGFPSGLKNTYSLLSTGEITLFGLTLIGIFMLAILALTVFIEEAQRRIPVQYAQRVVGRKVYGGQSTYLPLKVESSGVIAVIFAMAFMSFPLMIGQFFPNSKLFETLQKFFSPGNVVYIIVYAVLIVAFCYFYTMLTFDPKNIADNLKKSGGFIPGVRPGEQTAEKITAVMYRIILIGSLFVVFIAIVPMILKHFNMPFYFGGTALLIIVGVALDTMGQVESQLIMRHYDGLLKKSRIKGRYFNIK
ncbi:preprotein translocase subunit SecY [bacterium]|nr:preprotein translocase subunit SecY [bacterium]MBU3955455.1 preprotein translocase subunit SecY [bacterium]